MDAILGVASLDRGPADAARFHAMAAHLPWPPAPRLRVRADASAVMGHAGRDVLPEDVHAQVPMLVHDGRTLVVAEGRLDNREAVRSALGIGNDNAAASTDSTLIALAYERWGETMPPRLIGDWSVAAWSAIDRRLFLARDHHGNTSLHLFHDPARGRVAFASDARTLHAAGASARVDEALLAQLLVGWTADNGPRTLRTDVLRVPPAHSCVVTEQGVAFTRYWHPEDVPELDLPSVDAYAEALLPVLDEAVRARCRSTGTVAVTLSGGLDSGAVAALAARELRRGGRGLTALTQAPAIDPSSVIVPGQTGDESARAGATAAFVGITDHRLVRGAARRPLTSLRRALDVLGQPVSLTSNIVWVQDMMEAAADADVQVLLTGQHGNSTISWYGLPRLSLARRARVSGIRGVAHHLQPVSLERARARREHAGGHWPGTPITPELAARTDLAARMAEAVGRGRLSVRATSRQHRVAGTQPGASATGGLWNVLGASVGIDVRDPTADPRVIEFAWSVPDRFFRDEAGRSRLVLRTALTGLVPEEVRTNASLGRQAADVGLRLAGHRDEVEAAIDEIAAGPAAQYVSVPALRGAWAQVLGPPDPSVSRVTSSVLLAGLMAGWWVNDLGSA